MITEKVFILRTFKHGESDLIVHALNSKGAKLHLFARAALKSRKRFGGGTLEPTQYVQITYSPPRSAEGLSQLSEALSVEDFSALRSDFDRLNLGLYFVKVIDKVSFEGLLDSEGIFHLLGNALKSAQTSKDLEKLKTHFEVKLLGLQGVLPALPELEPFFQLALRDHEQMAFSDSSWREIRREIQTALENL